jgi:hypothetical protein
MTYRRMQEIDVLLDDQPELAKDMIQQDERNRQAHKELKSFNDAGKFAYKHPFVIKQKHYKDSYTELTELRRTDPATFLNEITNVTQNIRRIQSQLNKKKYKSEDERRSWEQNLEKATIRKQVLEDIISK